MSVLVVLLFLEFQLLALLNLITFRRRFIELTEDKLLIKLRKDCEILPASWTSQHLPWKKDRLVGCDQLFSRQHRKGIYSRRTR